MHITHDKGVVDVDEETSDAVVSLTAKSVDQTRSMAQQAIYLVMTIDVISQRRASDRPATILNNAHVSLGYLGVTDI